MADPTKATPEPATPVVTRNWKNVSKHSIHTEGAISKQWYKLAPGDVVAAPEGEFAHLPTKEIQQTTEPATVGAGKSAAEDLAGAKQALVKNPRKNVKPSGKIDLVDEDDDDED